MLPDRARPESSGAQNPSDEPSRPLRAGSAGVTVVVPQVADNSSLVNAAFSAPSGQSVTALSLLQCLGNTEIPARMARRGLTHLLGPSGPEFGVYLVPAEGAVTEPDPVDLADPADTPGPRDLAQSPLWPLVVVSAGGGPLPQGVQEALQSGSQVTDPQQHAAGQSTAPHLPDVPHLVVATVEAGGRCAGHLALLSTRADWPISPGHVELLRVLAHVVGKAQYQHQQVQTLSRAREQIFRVLGRALEHRSRGTKGHTDRVTDLALRLGVSLDLNSEELTHLRWGAYLHDIGKVAVADAVLHKPGPLNTAEQDGMRQHPTIGAAILQEQELVPEEVIEVVRHHHERWDGRGYPDGLRGTDIPRLARIFAVVDVYDALTSERPYKPSWSHGDTLGELRRMAGTHLDPGLVASFETMLRASPELWPGGPNPQERPGERPGDHPGDQPGEPSEKLSAVRLTVLATLSTESAG